MYGTQLLISETTARELAGPYLLREVDRIRVRGKSQPVAVVEVLDHYEDESAYRMPRFLSLYQTGLAAYRRREWTRAREAFEGALGHNAADAVSRLYVERCGFFLAHPPADDWDGVWDMKAK